MATSAPDLTQVVNRHDRPSPSFAGGSAGGPVRRAHHCTALRATTEAAAAARRTRERHGSSARTRAAAHTTPGVSQFEMRVTGSVCSSGSPPAAAPPRAQRAIAAGTPGAARASERSDRSERARRPTVQERSARSLPPVAWTSAQISVVIATLAPALADGRASSIVWARTPPRRTTRLPARCSTPTAIARRRPSAVVERHQVGVRGQRQAVAREDRDAQAGVAFEPVAVPAEGDHLGTEGRLGEVAEHQADPPGVGAHHHPQVGVQAAVGPAVDPLAPDALDRPADVQVVADGLDQRHGDHVGVAEAVVAGAERRGADQDGAGP